MPVAVVVGKGVPTCCPQFSQRAMGPAPAHSPVLPCRAPGKHLGLLREVWVRGKSMAVVMFVLICIL